MAIVTETAVMITLGVAWTLKLDREIGSIECGKRADFCVLDDDPLTVVPMALKDVGIWGIVVSARVFAASSAERGGGTDHGRPRAFP